MAPANAITNEYFPIKVSSNRRYLVDGLDDPFLIHGDTFWTLLTKPTKQEAEDYLENRRQKGFNATVVSLIETNPPTNVYGDGPFTTPGDFSTPNEAYFAHVDWVISKAAEKRILVLLNPAYFGSSDSGGWWEHIINNGSEKCLNYGRYLGTRYRNYSNIVWIAGGDRNPANASIEINTIQIIRGIKEKAPKHLWSAHWSNDTDAFDVAAFKPYLDVNGMYAYSDLHQRMLEEYNRSALGPTFLLESFYEDGVGGRESARRVAYQANLSGSTGQVYGAFGSDWPFNFETLGAQDMVRLRELFVSRPWELFVPDQDHTVVTAGYGTLASLDYVTVAVTRDRKLVMAYVPPTGIGIRSLTVNMTRLSGAANAHWFNPTTGTYSIISGSPFANRGSKSFTTPGDNGTGTNDWVLVLETIKSLTPRKSRR